MTAPRAQQNYSPQSGVVLAVDDDAFTRTSLSKFLVSEGIDCDVCSDPEEAVRMCNNAPGRYSIVLMDIRFPQGNLGFDASRQIRDLLQDTPPIVIGMTSHHASLDRSEWDQFGMSDIIPKPLFKWLVVNTVREHLSAA